MNDNDINILLYGIHSPMPDFYIKGNEQNIGKRWDLKAKCWDNQLRDASSHLNQDNAYKEFIKIAKNIIYKELISIQDITLLDVGCGTGGVSEELSQYFSYTIGIDVSNVMLEVARSKSIARSVFYNKSLFDLKSERQNFDLVVSRGVLLSHYGNGQSMDIFLSLYSVIKNGGFLVIDFLNKDVRGIYQHLPKNKEYFSANYIKKIVIESGYSNVEIIGSHKERTLIAVIKK